MKRWEPPRQQGLELLPRSKPDGKVTHTQVVVGGCGKDSESDAKLRGEEGTLQPFLTWFDTQFVISPGITPFVKWKFLETFCQRHHPISNEELE